MWNFNYNSENDEKIGHKTRKLLFDLFISAIAFKRTGIAFFL